MPTANKRLFRPFRILIIPIINGEPSPSAFALAHNLGINTQLIGLLAVPPGATASEKTEAARNLRAKLSTINAQQGFNSTSQIVVSKQPWQDLGKLLSKEKGVLLILDYLKVCCGPWGITEDLLQHFTCDLAIVRGPFTKKKPAILIPVRGGLSAELAMRLGMALPEKEIVTINLKPSGSYQSEEVPFKGLAKVLPTLPGIEYRQEKSENPIATILNQAAGKDLIILGAPSKGILSESPIFDLLKNAPCAVIMVRHKRPHREQWLGSDGGLAGAQAITLLVDRWFAENTYHASEFDDLQQLVKLKEQQGLSISLALPALNEEETVGTVIETIRGKLMDEFHLLDEIVLIDSSSSDQTRQIARDLGIPVHIHQEILPAYGPRNGKGDALWKSLLVTKGDIVVWIDTDIVNIHPRFVYGVLGPLLSNPKLQLVKGFYQRPLKHEDRLQSAAGGRVTELTARPLINLFYPELSGIIQPLAGEYGGRRKSLEQISFCSGYGVEINMLIEILERYGLESIGQVDLLERIHHNQTLEALSKMSFVILQAVLHRLEQRYGRSLMEDINRSMKLIHYTNGNYFLEVVELPERVRPPMVELPEYRATHNFHLAK